MGSIKKPHQAKAKVGLLAEVQLDWLIEYTAFSCSELSALIGEEQPMSKSILAKLYQGWLVGCNMAWKNIKFKKSCLWLNWLRGTNPIETLHTIQVGTPNKSARVWFFFATAEQLSTAVKLLNYM